VRPARVLAQAGEEPDVDLHGETASLDGQS
jgi:hypothetical protein